MTIKGWMLALALVAQTAAANGPAVRAEGGWARPTVAGQSVGGAYLTLTSRDGDRLLGARSPAAERVEVHEMRMDGDIMRMREVEALVLPPGRPVRLQPGGLHLMVVGLKAPLKAGTTLPLVLRFEKAGELALALPVTSTAPAARP